MSARLFFVFFWMSAGSGLVFSSNLVRGGLAVFFSQ